MHKIATRIGSKMTMNKSYDIPFDDTTAKRQNQVDK